MMTLYVFRERIRTLYQKYELYLTPAIKFIVGFVIFTLINKFIGYDTRLMKIPVVFVLALLAAFLPSPLFVLVAGAVSFAHIYSVSKILSIVIILILLILYLFFVRFTPRLGIVLLATPVLFLLKIPYVLPLLLGIIATPVSAVVTACGIVVYFMFDVIKSVVSEQVAVSLEDTLQLYKDVIDNLIHNKQMLITIAIFTTVIIITYIIRRLKIDYAYEIAIIAGGIANILFFLIGDLKLDATKNIISMILGTIASCIIVYVVLFFKQALDYTGCERVQFEDDDYVYYVKAVPKINVTAPQMNVKRINPQKPVASKNTSAHQYEYDDDMDEDDTTEDDKTIQ